MTNCLRKHAGARNEFLACAWLLDQGYEVFRNISQHGAIDVIATRGGELLRLDVKATQRNVEGLPSGDRLSPEQLQQGVKRLNVYPDGTCEIIEPANVEIMLRSRVCEHCGHLFRPSAGRQIFCRSKCREFHHYTERTGKIPLKDLRA